MSRVGFDVVVVGSELCGLAAAALIAQQGGGKRVVVIDDNDPSLCLPLGDRFAPTAPSVLRLGPTAGSDRSSTLPTSPGPVVSLLDSLGVKQDVRRALGELDGIGLVDDPEIRMTVPVEADARKREFVRVFGAEAGEKAAAILASLSPDARSALLAECASIHEDGLFERWRARRRVSSLGDAGSLDDDDPLAAPLAAVPLGTAGVQLLPFVQARPVVQSLTGTGPEVTAGANPRGLAALLGGLQLQAGVHRSSRGGLGPRGALMELLADVVRRHRGEVLKGRVESIEVEGKNLSVVRAKGANDYAARVVIDATGRRDLAARLPESRHKEKLLEQEKSVQPSGDAAVIRWLVPSAVLPRGLAPVSLVLRPEGAVLIGIYEGAPLREGHKAVGVDDSMVALVAATTCAVGQADAAAAAVEATLDALLPFARASVRVSDRLVGDVARSALQTWTVVKSEHPLHGRRPQTPYRNLLRAGRDLVPAFGPEGELIAARAVASCAERILGGSRASHAA